MTHFLRKMAAAWIILGSVSVGFAQQQTPPIPTDPNVRIGKLDNGLTYYIRHNELPEKRADFYIAQKVGSILEEDNQRGLAHFLEHMCFNGTKNFPDKTLIQYLESIGVKFGENLNAYTSIDETVYNISNVPVIRDGVVDSCLLILHDWADDLTLDPKEIDSERGVIHEEWRTSTNAMMRITRFKCKLDVKRCKRFVFPPSSLLPRSNALKTKAIRYFQTDRTLTRIVSPPLHSAV